MSVACNRTDSARSWRRRLPIWIECGCAAVVVTALAASAGAQQRNEGAAANDGAHETDARPAAPAALDAAPLEQFLANVDTLTADFELRVYSTGGSLRERSQGTMALDRPGKFRWHYAPPEEYLLWTDGEWLKEYIFDLEQLTETPLDDAPANPLSLLSGDGDFREAFDVVDRYTADSLDWVKLEPTAATATFTSVALGFDEGLPRRIELVDATDEIIRIDLTNLGVDADLPPDLFDFEPPEGATILGGS